MARTASLVKQGEPPNAQGAGLGLESITLPSSLSFAFPLISDDLHEIDAPNMNQANSALPRLGGIFRPPQSKSRHEAAEAPTGRP